MSDGDELLNAAQRKKKRRKERRQSERQAHRDLDAVTSEAIEQALRLAPEVSAGARRMTAIRDLDVELAAASEAHFVRKRVNEALMVGEWLDEVHVVVVETATNRHRLRLEQPPV